MTGTSLTPPLAQALLDPPGGGTRYGAALLHLVTLGHLGTEVEERLRPAEEVPRHLERDPGRALGIVADLGALVVLPQALRPHLGAIAEAARAHGAAAVPAAVPEIAAAAPPSWQTWYKKASPALSTIRIFGVLKGSSVSQIHSPSRIR